MLKVVLVPEVSTNDKIAVFHPSKTDISLCRILLMASYRTIVF
jgi:hypothetical protein